MNEPTIIDWIKKDFCSDPRRFIIEVIAWILSIACSITMAITVPNPPLIILYPICLVEKINWNASKLYVTCINRSYWVI